MTTAVVLGGGLSGLSAAYYLSKTSKFASIIVLEASDRLGGWAHTTRYSDQAIFEHGPRSFRPMGDSGKNTIQLAEELNLTDKVLGVPSSNAATKNRFTYVNGQIHKLPSGVSGLIKTQSPFTSPLFTSVVGEIRRPSHKVDDESIHSFTTRRFGSEMADFAINPFCRGVFAGDSKQLSAKSCIGNVFTAEQKYGSVIRGMLQDAWEKRKAGPNTKLNSDLLKTCYKEKWRMWSLKGGVKDLVEGLETNTTKTGTTEIKKNTVCQRVQFGKEKVKVITNKGEITADHVISSIYSQDLSKVLPPEHSRLSADLDQIPAVSCIVVNFEFGEVLPFMKQPGFGYLLPSFEDGPTLGVIYDSCGFQSHDKKDGLSTRLTVMMGGAWYDELVDRLHGTLDDDTIVKYTLNILQKQLSISAKPTKVLVNILKDCIPQYTVGHSVKLDNIFNYVEKNDLPLTLIGSSYKGVSVNDCIYNARLAAEEIAQCT